MTNQPIKILILTANPSNTSRLRLDQEVRSIEEELERAKSRNCFELISKWAVRVEDLTRALLEHKPQIVHFSGHGEGNEGLVLEDATGQVQFVKTEALASLFQLFKDNVRCVVLNCCYSDVQADAIYQHIDCVIGMNQAIGDKAAIKFGSEFYKALATGCSFNFAYQFAQNALDLASIPESSIPVLKNKRETNDPFAIATRVSDQQQIADVSAPPLKPSVRQSQSLGNVTFSGNNNPFNVIQSTGNVAVTQQTNETTEGKSDLQAALEALAKLKQEVLATDALSSFTKKDAESKIMMLEEELQKQKPDKSFVNEAVNVLKQGLEGVATLADPVTKVAKLIATAWVGLF